VLSVARVKENWLLFPPRMVQFCPKPAVVSPVILATILTRFRAILAGLAVVGVVLAGRCALLRRVETSGPRPWTKKGGAVARLGFASGSAAVLFSPSPDSRSAGAGQHHHTVRRSPVKTIGQNGVYEIRRARLPSPPCRFKISQSTAEGESEWITRPACRER